MAEDHSYGLAVLIDGVRYVTRAEATDAGRRIVMARPKAQKTYTVDVPHAGGEATCDCPDFVYRRQGLDADCKHIAGLRSVGLLPARKRAALRDLGRPVKMSG